GFRPLVAAGTDTYMSSLLTALNATNVVGRKGFVVLDLEALAARAPQVGIDATMSEAPPQNDLLDAFGTRRPRVVRIANDAILRPGPRLGEGLALLERALRPVK